MAVEGQTGVVALVAPADPVLTTVARRFPDVVRKGVPAHVSLLYPFLPSDELDVAVLASLSETLRQAPPTSVELVNIQREDHFVALLPTPDRPIRELTTALRRKWPHLVPYGGRFGEPAPHVTVALSAAVEQVNVIADEVLPPLLPITAELRNVWLVAFSGGRWTVRQTFALGTG